MRDEDRVVLEQISNTTQPKCCYKCADVFQRMSWMILCPVCGNKRCPKATDHELDCTGSNKPGQTGSRYS